MWECVCWYVEPEAVMVCYHERIFTTIFLDLLHVRLRGTTPI